MSQINAVEAPTGEVRLQIAERPIAGGKRASTTPNFSNRCRLITLEASFAALHGRFSTNSLFAYFTYSLVKT